MRFNGHLARFPDVGPSLTISVEGTVLTREGSWVTIDLCGMKSVSNLEVLDAGNNLLYG